MGSSWHATILLAKVRVFFAAVSNSNSLTINAKSFGKWRRKRRQRTLNGMEFRSTLLPVLLHVRPTEAPFAFCTTKPTVFSNETTPIWLAEAAAGAFSQQRAVC